MPTLPGFFALFAATCLTVVSSGATAQSARWFRVELFVFAQQPAGAATTEQWDPTPPLAYPDAARFLVEPERVQANLASHSAEPVTSVIDEYGRQILTIGPDWPANGLQPEPAPDIPRMPDRAAVAVAPGLEPGPVAAMPVKAGNTPTANAPAPMRPVFQDPTLAGQLDLLPTPFITLPASQQEFRGKAALMERSGRYTTLFHEAWLQPIADEAGSLPIVLDRSGDTHQWPQLQGSIKLYLSRFLQLETNLWLNTTGAYLPGNWRMPAPPFGPPSLIVEESLPPMEAPLAGAGGDTTAAIPQLQELAAAVEPIAEQPAEPAYPWRHAVLLQQKRRMRSAEVHYIDQPMFGVVVKVTPVSLEELNAQARVEAAETAESPTQSP